MTRQIRTRRPSTLRAPPLRATLAMLAAVAAALVVTTPASAWDQFYAWEQPFGPGGIALSGFNYNIHYNSVSFDENPPYYDEMQLTLCNSSYQCYPYFYSWADFHDDRSISYGRAKCNAYIGNDLSLWVHHCYTHN
jgi:hypothetical protein